MRRCLLAFAVVVLSTLYIRAQHAGCNSSYSRFGLGLLSDESQTWNRSMGGVGVALPSNSRLSTLNPASYAYIDSLSFILDAGMTAGFGRVSQSGSGKNVRNVSLDYVTAGFRLRKGLGMTIGFRPYTVVGYNFVKNDDEKFRDEISSALIESYTQYNGSGGLNRAFAGIGWRPFSRLSVGAEVSILWGSYAHEVKQYTASNSSVSSSFNSLYLLHGSSITSYMVGFGAQYAFRISPTDFLSVGATCSVGHNVGGTAYLYRGMDGSSSTSLVAPSDSVVSGIDIPWTAKGGVAWHHKNNLIVSADFAYQGWGSCLFPTVTEGNKYAASSETYRDSYGVRLGTEYIPDPRELHKFFKRMRYRTGFSYTSSSIRVNGINCPAEFTASIGVGVPIINRINSRSVVNVGLQYVGRPTGNNGLVKENFFMINIGLNFNERWFMKFKIQ